MPHDIQFEYMARYFEMGKPIRETNLGMFNNMNHAYEVADMKRKRDETLVALFLLVPVVVRL